MLTKTQNHLHAFLSAVPVNLALVIAVLGFPDYAWDIILGTGSFLGALLLLSSPRFSRSR
jgi:hypothetical protein